MSNKSVKLTGRRVDTDIVLTEEIASAVRERERERAA
jgi:hypothetical protein